MSPDLVFATTSRLRGGRFNSLAVFMLAACSSVGYAIAQESDSASAAGPKRAISIVPRITFAETLTDNVRLTTSDRRSELVTEISPGVQISGERGRVRGYFDYALNGKFYAQNTAGASVQNALTAFGTFEAVDQWAFVDLNAGISQQAISVLGSPAVSSASINANQTETATFRLSPYLRGRFANMVDYETRYTLSTNRSQSAIASDITTRDGLIRLTGRGSGARLGWSLEAGQQNTSYSVGRTTESDRLSGALSYAVMPQLNLSASLGQESNNFTTVDKQSNPTAGFGVTWTPSENTSFAASRDSHSYGNSHSVSFLHRTPRTSWRFSDSTSVAAPSAQNGLANLGSAFDIYFAQFASVEPDPVKRAVLVSNFLQANGINPGSAIISNFATSAASLQRRQDLSFSLFGIRDTITFIATRGESSRLDTVTTAVDDLSNSAVIRQVGLSVSYAHKLTPDSAFNVLASAQQSSDSLGLQDSNTRSVNLSLSTRVGAKTTAVISARRVVFESNANPYTESAITGTLNLQF